MRRLRMAGAVACAAAALGLAGCGGGSLEASTDALPDGTEISPRTYLADADAAARAIREFSGQLEEIGPVARPARLRELAPSLAVSLAAADSAAGRLAAARLADSRLEAQRARVAPLLDDVVAAMAEVTRYAAAGQPVPAAAAVDRFATAVRALQEAEARGS